MSELALIKESMSQLSKMQRNEALAIRHICYDKLSQSKSETNQTIWRNAIAECNKAIGA